VIETIYGTNNGTSLIILAESCFWGRRRQGWVASTPLHIAQLQGQVEIAVTVLPTVTQQGFNPTIDQCINEIVSNIAFGDAAQHNREPYQRKIPQGSANKYP